VSEYIHIVALDAPAPPDYGGAIDIYYKIVALAAIGKKVILHYFDYKERRGISGLEGYCYKVYSYRRLIGIRAVSLRLPYIVRSRINKDLIKRLNQDNYPVILEGIHASGISEYINCGNRKVVLRLHNNEAKYYKALARTEHRFLRKLYYLSESFLLRKYQERLPKDICIAGLSITDLEDFQSHYFTNLHFIPAFIPWQEIRSKVGTGEYCLYHGNMTVSENEEAVVWLIDNIFSGCSIPFIIAGKGISSRIIKKAAKFDTIQVISDPSEERLQLLLSNAQLNILPSFNTTGIKLKLLNALFNGRYCLTNWSGVAGSNIHSGVIIAGDGKEMIEKINHFFTRPFSKVEVEKRELILKVYDHLTNANKLNALIS
jgi:glycosyltransferase involved in cell wall biosynthesis